MKRKLSNILSIISPCTVSNIIFGIKVSLTYAKKVFWYNEIQFVFKMANVQDLLESRL